MGRQSTKVKKTCLQCETDFLVHACSIKQGGGKFCSRSCATTYRNTHDNPAWRQEVRTKISANHADVSGSNNPMYGKRGKLAPSYIDGRNSFVGEKYRKIMLANTVPICSECGESDIEKLHVHHKDHNHSNNDISNLKWLCVSCHNNIYHARERDAHGRFTSALRKEVI